MISGKFHIVFIFFIVGLTPRCFGQFGADFSVVSDEGCANFNVTVINESTAPSENVIVYNYGDGTPETSDTFHIYTSPGIYNLVQTVANGDPRQDSLFITVIDPQEPEFILANCKGTEAFIYITDTVYNAFWVNWGDGNSEKLLSGQLMPHDFGALGIYTVTVKGLMDEDLSENDLANVNCFTRTRQLEVVDDIVPGEINRIEVISESEIEISHTVDTGTAYYLEISENGASDFSIQEVISGSDHQSGYRFTNLNTVDNYYCFRITAVDFCDPETRSSRIGCSVNLTTAPENNQQRLTWTTRTTDLDNYEVQKDGTFLDAVIVPEYVDTLIQCGIQYCYQTIMNEINGLVSVSNTSCATAISSDVPPAIENVSASVEDNVVEIAWEEILPSPSVYEIEKTENSAQRPTITLDESAYTDTEVAPDRNRYFYQVRYEDQCQNFSPPISVSPVFLSASGVSELSWSRYEGWQDDPVSYSLEKYTVDGQLIATVDMGNDTVYVENNADNLPQQVIYRVVAFPNDTGLPVVNSNFHEMVFSSTVVFPNAFTPNGDGLNDFFTFKGKYVNYYKLTVFNRWGELIFETEEMDTGWDGTFNAQPVPSGIYIFNAEFEDEMGVQFTRKGEIYLIR